MSVINGMSATEMITEVAGHVEKPATDNDTISNVLIWLNKAQSIMFKKGDWADLRVISAVLTTDGSDTYDLSSELHVGLNDVVDFGRLVDRSVRLGTYHIYPISKSYVDEIDPDRTDGGSTRNYFMLNRKIFGLYPNGSSGGTVILDYIKLPTKLESTTEADDISFYPENHSLICDGAKWMAKERYSREGWRTDRRLWFEEIKKAVTESAPVNFTTKQITPILF
jgi:hypothetical protein